MIITTPRRVAALVRKWTLAMHFSESSSQDDASFIVVAGLLPLPIISHFVGRNSLLFNEAFMYSSNPILKTNSTDRTTSIVAMVYIVLCLFL